MNETMFFRAKYEERYYTIDFCDMVILHALELNGSDDKSRFNSGNYFATKQEAEKALEIIKSALVGSEAVETVEDILKEVDKMAEEYEFVFGKYNYFLEEETEYWTYDGEPNYKGYGTKYITSDEEKIIDIVKRLNIAVEREDK